MRAAILGVVVVLGGCVTAPVSFTGLSPDSQDAMFSCALRRVNELGYTVTNTDRDAALITGTKQTSGFGTALLTGSNYHEQLTVSVYEGADGRRTMRVTAAQVQEDAEGLGRGSRSSSAPGDIGKADAMAVLTSCAPEGAAQQTTTASTEFEATGRGSLDLRSPDAERGIAD